MSLALSWEYSALRTRAQKPKLRFSGSNPPLSRMPPPTNPPAPDGIVLSARASGTPLSSFEIFAGAGGLALGVKQAGFRCVGLVDKDGAAAETLSANARVHLGIDPEKVHQADARTLNLATYAGVDLLAGGPPCQPFSTGGKSLGPDDTRNMFPAYFRAVSQLMPRALLIENVKGLTRPKFERYFRYILKQLEFPLRLPSTEISWVQHYELLRKLDPDAIPLSEQYEVRFQVIDAADFGVPQRRERIIISAFRRDTGLIPPKLPPTHSRSALLLDQHESGSYWARHGLHRPQVGGQTIKGMLDAVRAMPNANLQAWITVRDALHGLPAPSGRGMPEVEPANHVQHPGARSYPGHTGSDYDLPAKALKAGSHGTPGGENIIRVCANSGAVRYLTVREAARLQTYPDDWRFLGSWGACIRQLGNAVPVRVGYQFADAIRKLLQPTTPE